MRYSCVQRWAWWCAGAGTMLGATVVSAQPDDRSPREPERAPSAPARKAKPPSSVPTSDPVRPALRPVMTEILYSVPTGDAGDANGDGTRHVSGDEFVEIVNPNDEPVQMLGYVLTDSAAGAPRSKPGGGGGGGGGGGVGGVGGVRFVFPAFELPAHGVVVVFNGNGATWAGPVGDAKGGPAKPDEKFGGAYVFTMRQSSQRAALGNASDAVILSAPDGVVVQRVRWGKAAEGTPDPKIALDESAPVVNGGSVVRIGDGKNASWRAHAEVDLKPFSPGVMTGSPAKPAVEPPAEEAEPKSQP